MSGKNVLLAGATGLVGAGVLRELLRDRDFKGRIVAPARRAPELADPRLLSPVVDFASSDADRVIGEAIAAHAGGRLDAFVCCLGTTIKAAGSREAFIAVDRELVLRLAQLARGHGARHAILVSSAGASRQSANFYLRVKGEVEDALEKMGFERLDILQPGLLLGQRSERRPAEALFQRLAPIANLLMKGRFRAYRAIDASVLSRAIVALLGTDAPGSFSYAYDAIRDRADAPD